MRPPTVAKNCNAESKRILDLIAKGSPFIFPHSHLGDKPPEYDFGKNKAK
jgi:hypothetical protein